MERLTLTAHAKINLSLSVVGKRDDGYHLLESVMQEISLADEITMEKIPSGILISCDREGIPTDEKNLCYRAAEAYQRESGLAGGVKIHLAKGIPDGAGLGGGSADAAAVLKGMALLYPCPVSLQKLAPTLGADVPFCLQGGTCLCRGAGEDFTPLAFPHKKRLCAVVAKGKEGLSTPRIYALLDKMCPDGFRKSKTCAFAAEMEKGRYSAMLSKMENHLELPAMTVCEEVARLKEALLLLGADGAMMTGSGSAVFGLFSQEETAKAAKEALKKEGYFSAFVRFL